jgi:hypothetical protein
MSSRREGWGRAVWRSVSGELARWKDDPRRKPLVITGVRQCGKTYAMREFGASAFADVAYVNFERDALAASVFEMCRDPAQIVAGLSSTVLGKPVVPGKTLLVLDEIQACPQALTALKYFCEDLRGLHVVCAGSLLGVALTHQNISFPVGKVDRLQMYPMSFPEFVRATGGEGYLDLLGTATPDRPLPEALVAVMERAYRDYLIVGGMPEVVVRWVETNDYAQVEEVQRTILADYEADFAKHAPVPDVPKLGWVWSSVPKQLAKENNKFVFSHVKEGKRAHALEDALQWLVAAGLAHKTELVTTAELPLSFHADATYFKVYLADVGLLRAMSNVPWRAILAPDASYARFRGAVAENYVHNELVAQGIAPYFWRSGNTAEVDFVFEREGRVVPVEVKAADNTMAKSYRLFCKRYGIERGFKLSLKNIASNLDGSCETLSLPLYLAWRLGELAG